MAADADSQTPVFLERIRALFRRDETPQRSDEPRQGLAVTVCVLLSLMLWLSLTLQERRTITLQLPVNEPELPPDRAYAELPPSHVSAQVQGSGVELVRLLFDPPAVNIENTSGTVDVEAALGLARRANVQTERITPATIQVETEPRVERRVPVRLRATVEPAPAHELIAPPAVQPDSVTVAGAQSVVERLRGWPTDSLSITSLRDTVQRTVPLADTLGRLVQRSADAVTMTARAGRFSEDSRQVTVQVTGAPSGQNLVALQPSTIRIRYRVLFDQLFQAQQATGFSATVSYEQIRTDTTGYVEPNVYVPPDLLIRDPEPVPPRLRYYTSLSEE